MKATNSQHQRIDSRVGSATDAAAQAGHRPREASERSRPESWRTGPALPVDAHVHIHDCFDLPAFLDRAWRNLDRAARRSTGLPPAAGGLMLSETLGADAFGRLRAAIGAAFGDWRVEATAEARSLQMRRGDGAHLLLVAGRQIATAEGLEVLALGCDEGFEDDHPMRDTLQRVTAAGALAVLPWGFGKWTFQRRRLIEQVLRSAWAGAVWLGDNAGRLRYGPRPRLFDLAAERGTGVLPGSDPLPLRWHVNRPGRCGFLLPGNLDIEHPAAAIHEHLSHHQAQPEPFGRCSGLVAFVRDQAALRMPRRGGVR